MKKYALLILLCSLCIQCKENEKQPSQIQLKTNIVLINIDDLGWRDLGYMGSRFFETPNIDTLATMGMVFDNGYAAAANCAPSRASLMTGQWLQRHGIYTVGSSERGKSVDRRLIPTTNTTTLPSSKQILPEILRQNGYSTCHAGKWHLTDNPLENGFDVNIGGSHAGHPSSYYPPYKNVALEAEEGQRLTDLIMDKTIDFIKNTKSPFFINYAPYAVHTPIQPVKELIGKYKDKQPSKGQDNVNYATMIENMDHNIGRLIQGLKDSGHFDNTFIVFTSDNGGLFKVSNQHPLRAGKGSYYEGGIRVPFFFVWKGNIKENGHHELPISNLDLLPTVLEIARVTPPENLTLDGQNLAPILVQEGSLEERPLFWHFPVYLQAVMKENENRDPKFRTRPGSVIRYGKWKLHHYFEDNGLELYDLEQDLGETTNLAQREPEKVKELLSMLEAWRARTNAPVPTTLNPDYKAPSEL